MCDNIKWFSCKGNLSIIWGLQRSPKFIPLPWRGVLHTTEGNLNGALEVFGTRNFWPHFTIEPNTLKIIQHISLNIG